MEMATEAPVSAGPANPNAGRYICHFGDCGKAFIRKEHLTRHERSHTQSRSFICPLCQRGFTRNDILRRHISRHTHITQSSDRNGRACDGCHTSKIRCEGGTPCSNCSKKGIDCRLDRDEGGVIRDATWQENSVHHSSGDNGTRISLHENPLVSPSNNGVTYKAGQSVVFENPDVPSQQTYDFPRHPMERIDLPSLKDVDQIGRRDSILQLQSNLDESVIADDEQLNSVENRDAIFQIGTVYIRAIPDGVTKENYDLYLDYFHHRWPVIHIPTFEKGSDPYILAASVEMIGAWLQGTFQSGMIARTLHDRLSNHIFQKLYQKPSFFERYKSWVISLYQAALLNIIFAIYCGTELLVSRALVMRSTLISSLRDMGFFQSEIESLQEKGATFYPYIMNRREERKRLAVALFKVDCYLSIIRGQPMMLKCDELFFTLPSTFCLYNGAGLHMFDVRNPEEPVQRGRETICSMISDNAFSSITQPFMLVEDIQLGMCAIQADIWQYSEMIHSSREDDISNLFRQKSLRERLDSWKRLLEQTSVEGLEESFMGKTNLVPLKYYYGVEDQSEPNWRDVVLNRPKSLLLDTTLLYHNLGIQIHANIRNFFILSSSRQNSSTSPPWTALKMQESRACEWTKVVCSRQAVWHAAEIINIHKSEADNLSSPQRAVNGNLDPIAHVAVSHGSLVIWAYCVFADLGCHLCTRRAYADKVVELSDISVREAELETWIQAGGRAALDGIELCRCSVETLMKKFRDCLPSGAWKWDMADSLSGVLQGKV